MTPLEVKAAIRARDGQRCAECGMTNQQHLDSWDSSLQVHRVVPGSVYSLEEGACVTLCRNCHGSKPKRPKGTVANGAITIRLHPLIHLQLQKLVKRHCNGFRAETTEALTEHLKLYNLWPPTDEDRREADPDAAADEE